MKNDFEHGDLKDECLPEHETYRIEYMLKMYATFGITFYVPRAALGKLSLAQTH